jgi:hypothetical protein
MSPNLSAIVRLLVLFIFCGFTASAQSDKPDKKEKLERHAIPDEDIEALKGKTAIFILPYTEYPYYEDYADMLLDSWTLTPLKVVKFGDVEMYLKNGENYVFFLINSISKTAQLQKSGGVTADFYSNEHYYINLMLTGVVKDKLQFTRSLCRIELFPGKFGVFDPKDKNATDPAYSTTTFKNFKAPFMAAYLKIVQQNIMDKTNPPVYKNYKEEAILSKVKNDTLYVIDSLLYSVNRYNGREEKPKVSLFEDYQGKYKIVSTDELIDIIQTRDKSKPVYIFEYVISSTDKYVGILDVRSGKVIKRSYSPLSYGLKSKDIKNILE